MSLNATSSSADWPGGSSSTVFRFTDVDAFSNNILRILENKSLVQIIAFGTFLKSFKKFPKNTKTTPWNFQETVFIDGKYFKSYPRPLPYFLDMRFSSSSLIHPFCLLTSTRIGICHQILLLVLATSKGGDGIIKTDRGILPICPLITSVYLSVEKTSKVRKQTKNWRNVL